MLRNVAKLSPDECTQTPSEDGTVGFFSGLPCSGNLYGRLWKVAFIVDNMSVVNQQGAPIDSPNPSFSFPYGLVRTHFRG